MITQLELFIESIDKIERSKQRKQEKIVYRGCRIPNHQLYDGMFFSEDNDYARVFGPFIEIFKIKIGKVLNLNKYNEICKEKIPDYYYYTYEPFIMHKNNITDKWQIVMDGLYINNLANVADEFQKELEECDTIFGSDAGESGSKVWYVKHKENIIRI
jgi:hypothetical protein